MKKIIIGITIVISCLLVTGCFQEEKTDATKFKKEYESLNHKKNKAGKEYPTMSISKNNGITYVTEEETLKILDSKTGIIYMGYPECPWCRNALPVLFDAANENNLTKIYYLDMSDNRDEKELDKNGKIKVVKEGTKRYQDLVVRMYDFLDVYEGLNDISVKRIYVPLVIAVKEGKILSVHSSTVNSQDDPYVEMTKEQKKELKKIYTEMIKSVEDEGLCGEAC